MKTLLLVIANMLLVCTVVLYFRNVAVKGVTPNPTNFFIRSVVATMNCVSYFSVVDKDYFKFSVAVVSAAALILVFFYALFRGRMTRIRAVDIICGSAALVVGAVWKTTGNTVLANLLLQAIMLFAFYPAISGVLDGVATEKVLPWLLGTLCYVFMTVALLLDWNNVTWQSFVFPVVSGIIGNGSLMLAVWWANRRELDRRCGCKTMRA